MNALRYLVSALLVARRAVQKYGPPVAQASGVSMHRQLTQLALLGVRYGISPEDYYRYRMYGKRFAEAAQFVPLDTNITRRGWVYRQLSIKKESLSDKRLFYRRCSMAALPVAETVAEFENGAVRWWSEGGLPECDLFAKEGAALCGAGAVRWDLKAKGQWSGDKEQGVDGAALIDELCEQSRSAMMILQRRLENHPDLIPFGPNGLCTVRVVTIRDAEDPTPELLLAVFRMPTGGNVADNFARGGLACPIDLRTGALGLAVYKDLSLAHIDVSHHPDSGAMISGAHLPYWNEVVDLALRAHRSFSEFPSVGWDIAITPQGPV
ncbi:MAG TPA: sugar-transfer associated ATP-grasp domain-containing protein, partial [Burkholderiales bacterium]|nr:sugar-transfer associated ATP-grasp domain-containing protein [Burkholderiales bacterium]